jgi:glucose dehydrogenase
LKSTEELDINKDVKKFFIGNATVEQHHKAQNENKHKYSAGMVALLKDGVALAQSK